MKTITTLGLALTLTGLVGCGASREYDEAKAGFTSYQAGVAEAGTRGDAKYQSYMAEPAPTLADHAAVEQWNAVRTELIEDTRGVWLRASASGGTDSLQRLLWQAEMWTRLGDEVQGAAAAMPNITTKLDVKNTAGVAYGAAVQAYSEILGLAKGSETLANHAHTQTARTKRDALEARLATIK